MNMSMSGLPTMAELQAGWEAIRQSPRDGGRLEMIVRRPGVNTREVVEQGQLDAEAGLAGDSWKLRAGPQAGEAEARSRQLTLMNSRVIALVARDPSRWPLAGDQLFVDLDLSAANLPPGTRLAVGEAVIEISAQPHTGCGKFRQRFGADALRFVNSPEGREWNLRGVNARVVRGGTVRVGHLVHKLDGPPASG